MLAIAFTGEDRATMVAHMRPRNASQKYSIRREIERHFGERRRQHHQREGTGNAAERAEPHADAERQFWLALARHGVGFIGVGGGGRRSRYAQEGARDVAGEDRHGGGRDDGGDGGDRARDRR